MKIRSGFVSNSSTSSFILKGFVLSKDDISLENLVEKLNIGTNESEDINFYLYEYLREYFDKKDLSILINSEDGAPNNSIVIGSMLQDTEYELMDMVIDFELDNKLSDQKQLLESIVGKELPVRIIVGTRCC